MTYFLAIPFANREDLLRRAIASTGSVHGEIVVIDNSPAADLLPPPGVQVLRPPVPLSFSQSMNWIQALAIAGGYDFYLSMHVDTAARPGVVDALLERARGGDSERWAVMFTLYDVLAAYNPNLLTRVGPWDTRLPTYFSDNDYYRRVRLTGFEIIETGLEVDHVGSATIRSDGRLDFLNSVTFPLAAQYYHAKWGGPPGAETFTEPFDGKLAGPS